MRRGVSVLYPSTAFQGRCLQRLVFCVVRPVLGLARVIHVHHQTALRPEQFKKPVFSPLERALERPLSGVRPEWPLVRACPKSRRCAITRFCGPVGRIIAAGWPAQRPKSAIIMGLVGQFWPLGVWWPGARAAAGPGGVRCDPAVPTERFHRLPSQVRRDGCQH